MLLLLFPPFLVFLAIIVLLFVASVLESRERRRRSAAARRLFPVLSLTNPLDPSYAIVWQTQLPVLEQMSAAGSMGLSVRSLRPSFSQLARRYPELYEGTTFEEWVGFLEQEGLARRTSNTMWLTAEGHTMLEHQTTPPSF